MLAARRILLVKQSSKEKILQELTEKAVALWGQDRAAILRSSLEQTATHLWEISQAEPGSSVEPGFFQ